MELGLSLNLDGLTLKPSAGWLNNYSTAYTYRHSNYQAEWKIRVNLIDIWMYG